MPFNSSKNDRNQPVLIRDFHFRADSDVLSGQVFLLFSHVCWQPI
jgi:hypothetical protein